MNSEDIRFCAWCGAEEPAQHTTRNGWFKNRRGEWFCCMSHREQSNRALNSFLAIDQLRKLTEKK